MMIYGYSSNIEKKRNAIYIDSQYSNVKKRNAKVQIAKASAKI